LPRFISKEGILKPYSLKEAFGQNWLKDLEDGKYANEHYLCHLGTFSLIQN
jgi:vacuolar protein sorting-associated protein 13A/C